MAAQEEERKRLANELHDTIGQTLAALKYGVEMILFARDQGDLGGAFSLLEKFVPKLQSSIEETRTIYMGLRPAMLEEMGVIATLRWFCQEFLKSYTQLHVEMETNLEEDTIPDHLKIPIFRIAQEALNNVAKHGRAEWIDLSLKFNDYKIYLIIADDGIGMDLNPILSRKYTKSLGLTGMKERAELSGGTFNINSSPGHGTSIRVIWPIA
jgi:signal transduction histidine kinase